MTDRTAGQTQNSPQLGGLVSVVGWIGGGALVLAALLFGLESTLSLPLSRPVAVGLGLALGGGIGGVARLFTVDGDAKPDEETVTVDVGSSSAPSPEPADLFDGHPDPVLYYAVDSHGPVVRAANASFGETFDVPVDRLEGTPLAEALLVAGEDTVDAETVTAGALDRIVLCETTAGERKFRLRTVGNGETGYLLYTPEN